MERGKKGWHGPLVKHTKGITPERIASEWNTTVTTVCNVMSNPEKQYDMSLQRLAGLHRLAKDESKVAIEQFINDQLVA